MIDINLFRVEKGGNPDEIKESQRKRNGSVEVVDEIINLDKQWIKLRFDVDKLNAELNANQKLIAEKKKAKENADELLKLKSELEAKKVNILDEMKQKEDDRDKKLMEIGNIVHSSVVDSNDEENNLVVRLNPEGKTFDKEDTSLLYHHEVLERLDAFDLTRGANVAGHRGYYLKNWGVRLNQALISYGMDFLLKKEYNLLQTPFFMKKDIMGKTAQLSQFDEELYKVSGDGEDKYLIATSEQPISAFHMKEFLEPKALPLRYGGYSTCFRKEAGAHGKDVTGIFRIHQFEKIEQFCLTEPEKSWEMFEEMCSIAEEFYKSLGLSYRVVSIVSGALNNAAAKKHDIEAWFPRCGKYRELVSCSNCTDYQSRNLEIRCGVPKRNEDKKYVHCLNATLCATERTLCCIAENFQTPEGMNVPKVLQPYLGGTEFIPFKKELTKKK